MKNKNDIEHITSASTDLDLKESLAFIEKLPETKENKQLSKAIMEEMEGRKSDVDDLFY